MHICANERKFVEIQIEVSWFSNKININIYLDCLMTELLLQINLQQISM